MKTQITAENFDLTESLRQYVCDHIEKLTRYRKDCIGATVALRVERHHVKGEKYLADVKVKIPGNDVYAEDRASDMRVAIDRVAKKIARQLQKGKERRTTKRQQPAW